MGLAVELRVEFQLPFVLQAEGVVAVEYQHRLVVCHMALARSLARVVEIKREPLLLHAHGVARGPYSDGRRCVDESAEHVYRAVEVHHAYHDHSIVVVGRCPVIDGIRDMQVVDIEGEPTPSSREVEGMAYLVLKQWITCLKGSLRRDRKQ